MSYRFHNLDNYIFERFTQQQKIDEYLEQIDKTKLEPIDLQDVEYKAWKLAEELRPLTASSWGCNEGFGEFLHENISELNFGDDGLSGNNKTVVIQKAIKLASVHQTSDVNLASQLVSFANFCQEHPIVFSF